MSAGVCRRALALMRMGEVQLPVNWSSATAAALVILGNLRSAEASPAGLHLSNESAFLMPTRSLAKPAAWVLSTPILLVLLYGLAAFASALLPAKGRPQSLAADDPALFVCASLAHADIVVPLNDEAGQWRAAFYAVAGNVPDSAYLAIGWGDLGFYRDTPRWSDLSAKTAFRALAGLGPTTLHVLAVNAPTQASACVKIRVDRQGREALSHFILATAQNDVSGHPRLIASPRAGEAFYAAKGRYSPWRTCNVWASQALAAAGMPAARWAPFSFDVMWPLGRGAQ